MRYKNEEKERFTIGIIDDVTNLSLEPVQININLNTYEIKTLMVKMK